jgi:hypothetical protein
MTEEPQKHSLWIYEDDYQYLISFIPFKKSVAESFREFLKRYKETKKPLGETNV